jgi:hypothetical protein
MDIIHPTFYLKQDGGYCPKKSIILLMYHHHKLLYFILALLLLQEKALSKENQTSAFEYRIKNMSNEGSEVLI